MSNKYLYLIPLVLIEVILQLAFFWLAPDVPCYWVVYVFGSALTLVHIGVSFGIGSTYGTRRSGATIVVGSICQIILLAICCVLLASGSNIRNAVFSLMIASMLYIVMVTLLFFSIENDEMLDSHTVCPFDDRDDPYYDELDNRLDDNNVDKSQASICTGNKIVNKSPSRSDNANLARNITPPPLPMRR